MICIKPISVGEDGGTGRKLTVACGQCVACRMNRARMWSVRLMHEEKYPGEGVALKSVFVTLTYEDKKLPKRGTLVKRHLRNFLKRLRKAVSPARIRFFACGEYGEKYGRPHYHLIIFGLGKEDRKQIEAAWKAGLIHVGTVTADSTNYVASYIMKKQTGPEAQYLYRRLGQLPEFAVMSRRPGIGTGYIKRNEAYIRNHGRVNRKGRPVGVPRFYSEAVFRSEEDKRRRRALSERLYREMVAKKLREDASIYKSEYDVLDRQNMARVQVERDLASRRKFYNGRKL